MTIQITNLWSPDLIPTDGLPEDVSDFRVLVAVELFEESWGDPQLFYLTVVSPSRLARVKSGEFIRDTLVLNTFSWRAVRARVKKLLARHQGAGDFADLEDDLRGFLKYGL